MKIRRSLIVFAALSLAASLSAAPTTARSLKTEVQTPTKKATARSPQVSVVALKVSKPSPGEKANAGGTFDQVMRMNRFDPIGTVLTFVLLEPSRIIIGVDLAASKIDAFQDDKGTNLAAAAKDKPGVVRLGPARQAFVTQIDNDGQRVTFDVASPALPAAGSTKLTLKGQLVLKVGAAEKVAEQKDLAIGKAPAKVTVGPVPYDLTEGSGFGGGFAAPNEGPKTSISLAHEKSAEAIKSIAFFGPDGKEIKSQKAGEMSSGFGDKMNYQTYYSLDGKVTKVTVKVTYFDKVESLVVPLDIVTGLGL